MIGLPTSPQVSFQLQNNKYQLKMRGGGLVLFLLIQWCCHIFALHSTFIDNLLWSIFVSVEICCGKFTDVQFIWVYNLQALIKDSFIILHKMWPSVKIYFLTAFKRDTREHNNAFTVQNILYFMEDSVSMLSD